MAESGEAKAWRIGGLVGCIWGYLWGTFAGWLIWG